MTVSGDRQVVQLEMPKGGRLGGGAQGLPKRTGVRKAEPGELRRDHVSELFHPFSGTKGTWPWVPTDLLPSR